MTMSVTGGACIPIKTSPLSTPPQIALPSVQVWASVDGKAAVAANIRNLAIFPPSALPVSYYPDQSYPSGFALVSGGSLVGVVALPAQYTVSFDLYPTADGTTWRSILRLTAEDSPANSP